MTSIFGLLKSRDLDFSKPFFINKKYSLSLKDIIHKNFDHLKEVKGGDVVALIGNFNDRSIADLLHLIERKAIIVPLTTDTFSDHDYFFDCANVKWVVENGNVRKISTTREMSLLNELRRRDNPGLVLFSTGTTGKPKAILHDFSFFLKRYLTPRPALITLNFLLFDHIGGINTLLHSIFNGGLVVSVEKRTVEEVLGTCNEFKIELLPTTPTFLRMMLMSGLVPHDFPKSIRIITYGTERMDEFTLSKLSEMLPDVDFRQTYGMSELGILRVKSKSRNSLFMKIGGEGITWRVDESVLKIKSSTRMMGYLNSDSPFDKDGWYDTKDLVEVNGDFLRIVGRITDVVNVAGLKFLTSEVEAIAFKYPGISDLSILVKSNPITGQHIEMIVRTARDLTFDQDSFKDFLVSRLPRHMIPRRISFGEIPFNHRFKKE